MQDYGISCTLVACKSVKAPALMTHHPAFHKITILRTRMVRSSATVNTSPGLTDGREMSRARR